VHRRPSFALLPAPLLALARLRAPPPLPSHPRHHDDGPPRCGVVHDGCGGRNGARRRPHFSGDGRSPLHHRPPSRLRRQRDDVRSRRGRILPPPHVRAAQPRRCRLPQRDDHAPWRRRGRRYDGPPRLVVPRGARPGAGHGHIWVLCRWGRGDGVCGEPTAGAPVGEWGVLHTRLPFVHAGGAGGVWAHAGTPNAAKWVGDAVCDGQRMSCGGCGRVRCMLMAQRGGAGHTSAEYTGL